MSTPVYFAAYMRPNGEAKSSEVEALAAQMSPPPGWAETPQEAEVEAEAAALAVTGCEEAQAASRRCGWELREPAVARAKVATGINMMSC